MGEYEACALAVQAAIDSNVKLLKVYRDSALVIHQLRGEWETRDPKLIPYQAYIKELAVPLMRSPSITFPERKIK